MPPVEWETSLLPFSFKFCASALDELCGYFALIPLQGEFGYYQFPMLCSILTNTLSRAGLFPVVMITMVVMAMILLSQPSSPIFKYVKSGKEFEKLGTAKPPFRGTNKSQKPFFLSFRSLQKSQVTQETT